MKELRSNKGRTIWIDDEDYPVLSQCNIITAWLNKNHEYALVRINKTQVLLHRWVMGLQKGDKGVVDHINQNALDNRKCNLRICTHGENVANTPKYRFKNPTSKYRGVYFWHEVAKRKRKEDKHYYWWIAYTKKDGKKRERKCYTEIDAAIERDKMAKKLYGEFAQLNFPYGAPDEDKSYFENGKQSQLNL